MRLVLAVLLVLASCAPYVEPERWCDPALFAEHPERWVPVVMYDAEGDSATVAWVCS